MTAAPLAFPPSAAATHHGRRISGPGNRRPRKDLPR